MNSQDIARQIYEQSDKKISLQDINRILDKHNSIIKDSLSKNEPVEISGLGTFKLNSNIVKPLVHLRKRVNPKKKWGYMFEIILLIFLTTILFYLYRVIKQLDNFMKVNLLISNQISKIESELTIISKTVSDIDTFTRYGTLDSNNKYEDGFKKLIKQEQTINSSNEK